MTAPTHISTTNTANTTNILSHSFNLPATVSPDDVLIAVVTMNYHLATPGPEFGDWTLLAFDKLHDYHVTYVFGLVADGTEDGGTVTFSVPTSCRSACQVLRISGAYTDVTLGVGVGVQYASTRPHTTSVDTPAIAAPWGAADNLFIALVQFGPWRADINAYPAGYSTNQSQPSGGALHLTASASKSVTATATDDPGSFTTTIATLMKTMALVVRPADAGVDATLTPSGGLVAAGTSTPTFTTSAALQVPSDVKVLWDFDNDGDFDRSAEDITSYVRGLELTTGRDFPNQQTSLATPGTLRLYLNNSTDQFMPTNLASELNTDPLSLDTGRKVRVRTSTATDPEPSLLLSDRHGTTGDLTETEQAEPWANVVGGGVEVSAGAASPDSTGETIAVADVRASKVYTQLRFRHCDADNGVGIIYRYANTDSYGLVRVQNGSVRHDVVSGGVTTNHSTSAVETRPHMTIGVEATADNDVTVYVEGVAVFTDVGDAASSTGTAIGMWWDWQNHRSPEVEEIYCWDGTWSTSTGVLFTGDILTIDPDVQAGPLKTAQVTAEGWLRRLAGPEVTPPVSIGVTTESPAGVTTGLMVGQTLASAGLLHPPPPGGLDAGDVELGGVGTGNAQAIYVARLFELAEAGFLYELPEGPVTFDDRTARVDRDVIAAIGDGTQIPAEGFRMLARGREIYNQATAEVSPGTPVLETVLTTTGNHAGGATAAITITLPSGAQASAGDLDLAVIVPACQRPNEAIEAPTGWTALGAQVAGGGGTGREFWFARKLTSGDLSDPVTFYTAGSAGGGAWLVRQFVISNWYGVVESGVAVSAPNGVTGSEATAGTVSQPTLLIPWGRQPCLLLASKSGMYTSGSPSVSAADPDDAPNGYRGLDADAVAATVATADVGNLYAWKHASTGVESPSAFGGTFTGFNFLEASTVAVRGYAGDPPETSTGELVTVDDLASQRRHNKTTSFPAVAQFFPDATAAEAWTDVILDERGADRPLLSVRFTASKSSLHRWLAYTLRVSDLVRVVADGPTGAGVNALYHVETITHRIDFGRTLWVVELQVSPAQ